MEHKKHILLATSTFMIWLSTITTSQIIGFLTVLVLFLTATNYFYSTQKQKLEMKKVELEIEKLLKEIKGEDEK